MWYYIEDKKPIGPLDEATVRKLIKAGRISRHTYVWKEGMGDWSPAKKTELASELLSKPPLLIDQAPVKHAMELIQQDEVSFPSNFKNPSELTRWLKILLIISIVVNVVSIVSSLLQIDMLVKMSDGVQVTGNQADANDIREALVGYITILLNIITGIFFLKWIYRANYNARQLGASGLKFSPGWSVGYYFIPIVNLWKPYQAMNEIWKASSNPNNWTIEPDSWLLGIWWILWVGSKFVGRAVSSFASKADSIKELINSSVYQIITETIDMALCVVAISLVTKIYDMQMGKLK